MPSLENSNLKTLTARLLLTKQADSKKRNQLENKLHQSLLKAKKNTRKKTRRKMTDNHKVKKV